MAERTEFLMELTKQLTRSFNTLYGRDNRDEDRFGKRTLRMVLFDSLVGAFNPILHRLGLCLTTARDHAARFDEIIGKHEAGLNQTYQLLADDYSRRALVQIMAFRILGPRHVKLWINTPEFHERHQRAETLPSQTFNRELNQIDLSSAGYPIKAILSPTAIAEQFLDCQYIYSQTTPPIGTDPGDYVIDGGGGRGDTTLRFAHEAGPEGKVFVFEFDPENLNVLHENLKLNPELAPRIQPVERALWSNSETTLKFDSNTLGTTVSEQSSGEHEVRSITIDAFAADLPQVDFIKMDIEGAELPALKGAEQTIRKHRPKLAICLYHSLSDFIEIPAWLNALNLDYTFHLDHASIHEEETVLFARAPHD